MRERKIKINWIFLSTVDQPKQTIIANKTCIFVLDRTLLSLYFFRRKRKSSANVQVRNIKPRQKQTCVCVCEWTTDLSVFFSFRVACVCLLILLICVCVCVHCLFRFVLFFSFVCVGWLSSFRSFVLYSIHFFLAQIQYRSSKDTFV